MKKVNKVGFKAKALVIGALAIIGLVWSSSGLSEKYIRDRVVKLSNPKVGMCSGEQVKAPSGVSYILSAAHCRMLADENDEILVTTEAGTSLKRKVIAEDPYSDLLLMEGIPGQEGLPIAIHDYKQEHVRTFTHGSNMDTYETEGALIQNLPVEYPVFEIITEKQLAYCRSMPKYHELDLPFIHICTMSVSETATTAKIVPGSSGGPVVDNSGHLVGVVSGGDDRGFGYLVMLGDIHEFLKAY